MASVTITISVVQDKMYKISGPANTDAYYSGKKVLGSGANNYFVANGTDKIDVVTTGTATGSITVTEVLRNYYSAYDGQGGTWVYQPSIDRYVGMYSFRPEWYGQVANRLASFKDGKLYVHDGTNNSFYAQTYDSIIALAHSDAGNQVKEYRAIAVEGDKPDRVHVRTEVPYIQSSDLIAADFTVREGVNYSQLYRDRLSPNASGTYDQKLFTGDVIRGELAKMMVVFTAPSTKKEVKFVNIDFDGSKGQTV